MFCIGYRYKYHLCQDDIFFSGVIKGSYTLIVVTVKASAGLNKHNFLLGLESSP